MFATENVIVRLTYAKVKMQSYSYTSEDDPDLSEVRKLNPTPYN